MTSNDESASNLTKSSLNQLASFLPSTPLSAVLPTSKPNANTEKSSNSHTARLTKIASKSSMPISNAYNPKIKELPASERKKARSKALEEAQAVLSADAYKRNDHLDNFNLLGVVTSPRLLEELTVTSATMQGIGNHDLKHGNTDSSVASTSSSSALPSTDANTSISSISDATFFTNISREIESLNTTLYSYSKNYLGQYGSEGPSLDFQTELGYDDVPKGQIPVEDLPAELLDLDLTTVEAYLRKCGRVAEHLKLRDDNGSADINNDSGASSSDDDSAAMQRNPLKSPRESGNPTENVPNIFFSQYFDLTDPKTFESLLVLDDDDIDDDGDDVDDSSDNAPIIRIQKQEKLTQHLDTIELALLNQVRSKSSSFFRETNRFSYLKSLVAESVEEVQSLRSQLEQIRERSITDAELIPIMDRRRNDTKLLVEVLDEIIDVIEVKGSVGGLIASGDYLGAVDAIHMARQLLNGEPVHNEGNGDVDNTGDGRTANDEHRQQNGRHVLRKVTALNKINDQLSQYENLVVMDLSNELVESFLSWNERNTGEYVSNDNFNRIGSTIGGKVKNTILAMKKCGQLTMMADIYRDKLCDTIRVTIRTTVAECAADAEKDSRLLIPAASATIVSIPDKSNSGKESKDDTTAPKSSIIEGVTSMSFDQFMECLDMIYEHVISLLKSAAGVNKFCLEEGISFKDDDVSNVGDGDISSHKKFSSTHSALTAGADLSHRSISEILRLRKDTHSLITFEEIRRLWDSCLAFTIQLERISGQKAYVLRSTLLSQAKAFVERKHEANMSSLAAALDTERWTQCDVSAERQTVLDRLCTGRAVLSTRDNMTFSDEKSEKSPVASVEGKRYRVVWSCLLLIEMVMGNLACAAHFQTLASNVVGKVSELLRLFNSRATQLVLGAGAIHSSARLKSINAKHLALVTQCVGVVQSILPHIRAALMTQLPSKQQPLLSDLDTIKKEYAEHHDNILSKFVSIIGGIVEHSLISKLRKSNFDERSKLEDGPEIACCPFLDGVISNTRKMHQVLISLLPPEDLMDVFSRIFAHLDSSIPKLYFTADADENVPFSFPDTMEGKKRIILEVETMTKTLNDLTGIRPWDFGAMNFLSRRLEVDMKNAIKEVGSTESTLEPSSSQQGQDNQQEPDNLDHLSGQLHETEMQQTNDETKEIHLLEKESEEKANIGEADPSIPEDEDIEVIAAKIPACQE